MQNIIEHYFIWDIGGSGIKAAILDADGRILCRWNEILPKSYDNFIKQLLASFREKRKMYLLKGIGLSLPAKVDFEHQHVLGYGSVPYLCTHPDFVSEISSILSVPVVIENDARCAAIGDYFHNRINNTSSKYVYIICGTGIGGAIVDKGQLSGNGISAPGEWGSLYAGGIGENSIFYGKVASIGAILSQVRKHTGLLLNGKEAFARAESGEEPFVQIISKFYFYLSSLAYNLHMAYIPDEIVFGGAVSQRPDFILQLNTQLEKYFSYSVKNNLITPPVLAVCKDGNNANIYGAFIMVKNFERGVEYAT